MDHEQILEPALQVSIYFFALPRIPFTGRQPGRKRNPLEPLHREIAILKKMDHPNIVKLVEVFARSLFVSFFIW